MYDRIAVPLDGSPVAFDGIGPGARLARVHRARLVLVAVATDATGGVTRAENVLAAGRARAEGVVDTTVLDSLVLDDGDAAAALAEFNASAPTTLLCMTTRGRGSARRALLGSTALSVVQQSADPVVLIGPRCDPSLDTPVDPLVTCLDGSAGAEAVLPWVTGWAARTDATIALVRVIEPLPAPEQGIAPTAEQLDDLAYLGNLGDRIASDHRGPIRHDTVQDTDPAAVIAAIAEAHPDAMVALAASGMGRLADLLVGSTTGDLLRTARVPLLVVTPAR